MECTMFQHSLTCVAGEYSGERAQTLATDLWGFDHWFDFAHFKRSAGYGAEGLQTAGLSAVESLAFPADGETRFADWVAPLAWDVTEAELKVVEPEPVPLVKYTQAPWGLVMWSAPTPPQGLQAEIVMLDKHTEEQLAAGQEVPPNPEWQGKILFSSRLAPDFKRMAARQGALGIVSDHQAVYGGARMERPPEKVSWINWWSDDPNGWPFTRRDAPAFGFSLSARQGDRLRDLFRRGQAVKAFARVDSRLYNGSFDLVTGVIPGHVPSEEVLVFAHLYEVGAQDNAGGCATVLEAARCLNALIVSGRLPQPRRSIRFMLSWEIYGLLAYAGARPDAMHRIVAGLNLDSLGIPERLSGARFEVHANPHAQASYTDVLAQRIAEHHLPSGEWTVAPFDTTDAVIADPLIGIPTPWLGEMTSRLWHSSLDTPEKLDPRTLAQEGVVAATYLYSLANAGPQDIPWLAREVYQEALRNVAEAADLSPDRQGQTGPSDEAWRQTSRRLSYAADRGRQALRSCARVGSASDTASLLADYDRQLDEEWERRLLSLERALATRAGAAWSRPGPAPLSLAEVEAAHLAPRRTVPGGLSLGRLPQELWPEVVRVTHGENPRWSKVLCCALYWADGQRSMLEVKHQLEQELGPLDFDLFGYFRFLSWHGYMDLLPVDRR
jgi:hypothetical protein